MVEMVAWLAQYRETQHVEVWSYGSASSLPNVRQTATKSLPTFKLDITVSYVGHVCQMTDVKKDRAC